MMKRVQMTQDLSFSRLVYGMWRLADDTDTSPAHIQAKVEACLAQGITTIDQADIYGNYQSQVIFGKALKDAPSLRKQIEIVSKCDIAITSEKYPERRLKYYDTTPDYLNHSVDNSLKDMAIDQLDLFLIHRPDPLMDHQATGQALDDLVKSGKVKAVGVSNFKPYDWELLQSGMNTPLVTNQIEMSVVEHHPLTNGEVAFHQRKKTPLMAWSPLAGGVLFDEARQDLKDLRAVLSRIAKEQDVELSNVAIAWLLHHPVCILPVLGTNSLKRIQSISDALKVSFDRQTWFEVYTASLGRDIA